MEDMFEEWKQELIEAGLLNPDEEVGQAKLMTMWQQYQIDKMRGMMSSGSFKDLIPEEVESSDSEYKIDTDEIPFDDIPLRDAEEIPKKSINPHGGIKAALDALLNSAKGANYCMIVVDRAWINFRYKRSQDNLHLQVAGNKYISPMELSNSDIKHLEAMGIPPEEGSDEIWATDFDDTPRNLVKITDSAISIFNDIYHVNKDASAYVELDLGSGEDESIRKEIAKFFRSRDGKKFKWNWI